MAHYPPRQPPGVITTSMGPLIEYGADDDRVYQQRYYALKNLVHALEDENNLLALKLAQITTRCRNLEIRRRRAENDPAFLPIPLTASQGASNSHDQAAASSSAAIDAILAEGSKLPEGIEKEKSGDERSQDRDRDERRGDIPPSVLVIGQDGLSTVNPRGGRIPTPPDVLDQPYPAYTSNRPTETPVEGTNGESKKKRRTVSAKAEMTPFDPPRTYPYVGTRTPAIAGPDSFRTGPSPPPRYQRDRGSISYSASDSGGDMEVDDY